LVKNNFLIFGAGALGTYIGGSLSLQGHSITFLERPEECTELRQKGIQLSFPTKDHQISNIDIAASFQEAIHKKAFDAAIFALKSYDTQSALESLRPYKHQTPPLLCLQNGVDNEPSIKAVLGDDSVIAGTVTSAIGRQAVGEITLERLRGIGIASGHPLSTIICQDMQEAGLKARLYVNASDMKWSKMLINLVANATSAILDITPAQVFSDPGLYHLEIAQLRECLEVMRVQAIHCVNLPGTPVKLLAIAVRNLPPSVSRPFLTRAVTSGRGGKMPSFYIDLHSGRGKSEVSYLNGAIVKYGDRLGVPTPANRILNDTLLGLTSGEIPLEAYRRQPEKLIKIYDMVKKPEG